MLSPSQGRSNRSEVPSSARFDGTAVAPPNVVGVARYGAFVPSRPPQRPQRRLQTNPFEAPQFGASSRTYDSPAVRSESKPEAAQGRYLYERLGEKLFQQMCGALVAHEFPGVTCMPVGQSDGGRDVVRENPDGGRVIYQVKWSANSIKSPVAWLKAALKKEADNIRRLVRGGATEYYLMTSVAGTSFPGSGSMDQLAELLMDYSSEFGIPMRCWWRADIDARVNLAPQELLWSYAEMLAGWDLIRYLTTASRLHERDERLRDIVRKVVATQWEEDSKVKFKQVDLDSYALEDLYVDVEAERLAQPRRLEDIELEIELREGGELGGVARYLLQAKLPLTLVRGAPGQGKSTLTQYLCQLHREVFLSSAEDGAVHSNEKFPDFKPRLPLRVDLRDYASWLLGYDPFDIAHPDARPTKNKATARSLESFLARLMQVKSGEMPVRVEDVHELIARFPLLIVLDGLDEVASADVRQDVVARIDELTARLARSQWAPQVVVTTRPNSSGLAEPSPDRFETIALKPLGPALRRKYLGKWADSRRLPAGDRATLQRIFEARSAEPHIAQLAENPMQLTILLYLIQKRGDSIPHSRTDLYRSYMQTFLDREAAKSPAVQTHRDDLEEVTAYLGWQFQSLAESSGASGQLPIKEIKQSIVAYLYDADKDTHLVEALFTAVTDRVWALTSKEQGSFRFDVQPVQEYFAASYLYHFAGAAQARFDGSEVFRALVRRPYWFNTCRFYAGFASVNELAALAEVLEEEIERSSPPFDVSTPSVHIAHTRMVIWTLLADGVFAARPRTQARVARLISDDLGVRLIADALDKAHDLPDMAADRGGSALVKALREAIAADPQQPINRIRAELVAHVLIQNEVDEDELWRTWWQSNLHAAAGSDEESTWLALGGPMKNAAHLPGAIWSTLALDEPGAAHAALESGMQAATGSVQSQRLLRAVLNGHCSDARPTVGGGEAAWLLLLWAPRHFHRKAVEEASLSSSRNVRRHLQQGSDSRLRHAKQLFALDARYERVYEASKTGKGQKGTTSAWSNTARELAVIHGPSLFAAEITVIGAALPADRIMTGGDLTKDSEPLGDEADYGRLLNDVRHHRRNRSWWVSAFERYPDHLSRATWLLSLLAVADTTVVAECLEHIDAVTKSLPGPDLHAVRLASSRTGAIDLVRRLDRTILDRLSRHSADTALLVLHNTIAPSSFDRLSGLSEEFLGKMIDLELCSWPATHAVHGRMLSTPSIARCELLRAGGPNNLISGEVAGELPDDLVRDVLTAPADVPAPWLRRAEAQYSTTVRQTNLADHARGARWFDSMR